MAAEAVVHQVVRQVVAHRTRMAQARVNLRKNRAIPPERMVVVTVELEVVEAMTLMVRTMVLSPSRIRIRIMTRVKAGEDTGNRSVTKRRNLYAFRCQTHYATERG